MVVNCKNSEIWIALDERKRSYFELQKSWDFKDYDNL
jgi:hypothetical protein